MAMKASLAFALGALTMTGAAAYTPAPPAYEIEFPSGPPAIALAAEDFTKQYLAPHINNPDFLCIEFVLNKKVVIPAGRRVRFDPFPTLEIASDLGEIYGWGVPTPPAK